MRKQYAIFVVMLNFVFAALYLIQSGLNSEISFIETFGSSPEFRTRVSSFVSKMSGLSSEKPQLNISLLVPIAVSYTPEEIQQATASSPPPQ